MEQLYMRHKNLNELKPLIIPDEFEITTHKDEYVNDWEQLIEKAFGMFYSFEQTIINGRTVGGYKPEQVLYLKRGNKILATATAAERDDYPGEGWFRMIATDPEEQGKGLGKLICLAALHSLKEREYKSAVLSTDDHRLPALKTYLNLGFEPICFDESHKERWEKVFEHIKK